MPQKNYRILVYANNLNMCLYSCDEKECENVFHLKISKGIPAMQIPEQNK